MSRSAGWCGALCACTLGTVDLPLEPPWPPEPRVHALLIGVDDYTVAPLNDLHASHDLAHLTAALLHRGVPEHNLVAVREQAADRSGILDGIAALSDRTERGDTVVLHYSGHGVRLLDDGRDEPDGRDEALVPYGARLDQPATLLRDDDLAAALDGLRGHLGREGHLLLSLDTCFSASAFRGGEGGARGGPSEPAPRGPPADTSDLDPIEARRSSPREDRAPMAVLTASGPHEQARETEAGGGAGLFSLLLAQALEQASPETSYRELWHTLSLGVLRHGAAQHPHALGALDLPVLGGHATLPPVTARVLRCDDRGQVEIDVGYLHGIGEGTVCASTGEDGVTALVELTRSSPLRSSGRPLASQPCPSPGSRMEVVTLHLPRPLRVDLAVPNLPPARTRLQFAAAELRTLPAGGDPQVQVELRLLAAVPDQRGGCVGLGDPSAPPDLPDLTTGLLTPVWRHRGTRPAHVVVLHLPPDGDLTVATQGGLPVTDRLTPGALVTPGQCITVSKQPGTHHIVLIASADPVNAGPWGAGALGMSEASADGADVVWFSTAQVQVPR